MCLNYYASSWIGMRVHLCTVLVPFWYGTTSDFLIEITFFLQICRSDLPFCSCLIPSTSTKMLFLRNMIPQLSSNASSTEILAIPFGDHQSGLFCLTQIMSLCFTNSPYMAFTYSSSLISNFGQGI